MERAMHKCTANDQGRPIEYWASAKNWYLEAVGNWIIYHCPYCGLKLEPPEPEFDVKAMAEYDAAMNKWLRTEAFKELRRLECLILGEKLEKPDVKIEVSRKMLRDWADRLDRARDDLQTGQLRGEAISIIDAVSILIKSRAR